MSEKNLEGRTIQDWHDDEGRPLFGTGFGGEKVRLTGIFREKLSKPMPKQAIKQHPTKSYLSTIKAIFIIERLNDVFGIGGWNFEHDVVGVYDNTIGAGEKERTVPYIVVCGHIYIREFDLYTPTQYGGHELNDTGTDPADGFKSAVTDALTKCASFLEIGIQVFKGNPTDQTSNKSKRLDQGKKDEQEKIKEPTSIGTKKDGDEQEKERIVQEEPAAAPAPAPEQAQAPEPAPAPAEPKQDPAPVSEPATEPDAAYNKHGQSFEILKKFEEVVGRTAQWNASNETMQEIINKEIGDTADERPDPSPVQEEAPAPPAQEQTPVDADAIEKEQTDKEVDVFIEEPVVEEEADDVKPFEKMSNKIEGYLDANTLKEEGGELILEAQMNGCNDSEVGLLKRQVNVKYKALLA